MKPRVNIQAVQAFHGKLHSWYGQHGRHSLPWRSTADPYAIYVSETMLQQTQVKTVLERYYHPFLKRFPTLKALARADRKDVLKLWQGLGYYNRAVNLHQAAQMCDGVLPKDIPGLLALPGIGRNTAHAIATFAYRQQVPVMEANVKRVLCRIFALKNPTPEMLWEKAEALLDYKNPFDYNQAMMDLGAMVCTKAASQCPTCPATGICAGKASPQSYPAPKAAKKVPVRHKRIAVFTNHKKEVYATTRDGKFLAGLYHFVEISADKKTITFAGKRYALGKPIGHIRQQYSHFTLEADVYQISAGQKSGKNWHSLAAFKALPKSMAETKILALL